MDRIDDSLPVDSFVQELSVLRHPLDLYDYCFWIIVVTLQELLRDAFSKMIHSFVDVDNSAPAATKVPQKMVSPLT